VYDQLESACNFA
jgi:hypothetical protein